MVLCGGILGFSTVFFDASKENSVKTRLNLRPLRRLRRCCSSTELATLRDSVVEFVGELSTKAPVDSAVIGRGTRVSYENAASREESAGKRSRWVTSQELGGDSCNDN